ncbi:MbtH family NRPS accessory protein [Streptomyces sp. NRRL F-4489]|uniref:MbtH family NRPS accessory protein n=1 Tax=Streptomyces sp. NRRL F-4489 TaxID=1609095 RepID=UPI000D1505DA
MSGYPAGWTLVFGEDSRQGCLDYVEENRTDMRPASLIRAREEAEQTAAAQRRRPADTGTRVRGLITRVHRVNRPAAQGRVEPVGGVRGQQVVGECDVAEAQVSARRQ